MRLSDFDYLLPEALIAQHPEADRTASRLLVVEPPRGEPEGAGKNSLRRAALNNCGCASSCNVHGHDHAGAWTSKLPIADLKGFFGALGCACWAV